MSTTLPTLEYERRPEDGLLALQVEYFFKMIPHLDHKFAYRNEQVIMAKDFANLLEADSNFMHNRITYLKRFSDFKLNQHLDEIFADFLDFYIQYVQEELRHAQHYEQHFASHTPEVVSGVAQVWQTSAQLAHNPQYTQHITQLEAYTTQLRHAKPSGDRSSATQRQQAQAFKAQVVPLLPNAPRDLGLVSSASPLYAELPQDPQFFAQLITVTNKTHRKAQTSKWYADAHKLASNGIQTISFDPRNAGLGGATSEEETSLVNASEQPARTKSVRELLGISTKKKAASSTAKNTTATPNFKGTVDTLMVLNPEGNLNQATFKILVPPPATASATTQASTTESTNTTWDGAYHEGREHNLSYAEILRLFLKRLQPRDYGEYASLIQGSLRAQERLTLHLTRYLIEEGCFGQEWQQDFLKHFTTSEVTLEEEAQLNPVQLCESDQALALEENTRLLSLNDALNDAQLRLAMIKGKDKVAPNATALAANETSETTTTNPPETPTPKSADVTNATTAETTAESNSETSAKTARKYNWIGKPEVAVLRETQPQRNEQTALLDTLTRDLETRTARSANTSSASSEDTTVTSPTTPVSTSGSAQTSSATDDLMEAIATQANEVAAQTATVSEADTSSNDFSATSQANHATLKALQAAKETSVLAQMRWLQGCLVVDQFLVQNPHHLDLFLENHTRFKMAFKDLLTMVREAPTGTGKSLAYLVPIVLGHKRALVSTHVKSLQDQLLEDLPYLGAQLVRVQSANQEVDNFPIGFTPDGELEFGKFNFKAFNFRPLKGQTNYLCPRFIAFLGQAFQQARSKNDYVNSFDQLLGGTVGAAKGERALTSATEKLPLEQIIASFIPSGEIKRLSEDLSSEEFAELEQHYSLKKAPQGIEVLRKHDQSEQSLCVISHIQYKKIQEFCRSTPVRDWETDQLREVENLTADLRSTLTLNHEDCPGMKVCGFGKVCPFRNARLELQDADIGILNHSLLISASLNQLEYTQDRDVFVCDEAHNMVSVLKDTGHIAVNQQQVSKLFNEINTQLHFDPLNFDELFGTQLAQQEQLQQELLEHLGYDELRASLRLQAQRKVEIPERDYLPIDYNFVTSVPQAFLWQSNTVNVAGNRTLAQLVSKILSDRANFTHRTYDFFNVFNPLTVLEYDLVRHPLYLFYSFANELELEATSLPLPLHLAQQLEQYTFDAQRNCLVPRAQATTNQVVNPSVSNTGVTLRSSQATTPVDPNYTLWEIAYQLQQQVSATRTLRFKVRSNRQELDRISALRADFNTPDHDLEVRLSYARRLLPLKEENRTLKDYLYTTQKNYSYRASYIDSTDYNLFDKLPDYEILKEVLGTKAHAKAVIHNQVTIQRQLQGLLPLNLRLEDSLLRLWQISLNTGRDIRVLYTNSLAQQIRDSYQNSGIVAMFLDGSDPLGLANLAHADNDINAVAPSNETKAPTKSPRGRKSKEPVSIASLAAQNYISLGHSNVNATPAETTHPNVDAPEQQPQQELLAQLETLRAQHAQRGNLDPVAAEAQWLVTHTPQDEQSADSSAEVASAKITSIASQAQALNTTSGTKKTSKKSANTSEDDADQYCKVASYVRQNSWTNVYDQLDRWWIKQDSSYRSFLPEYLQFKPRVPDRLKLANRESERALAATSLDRLSAHSLVAGTKYIQLLRSYFQPQHHTKTIAHRFALLSDEQQHKLQSKLAINLPSKDTAHGVDSLEDAPEFSTRVAEGAYLRWLDTQLLHAMFAPHASRITSYLNEKFWWQQEQAHLLRYRATQEAQAYLDYYQPQFLRLHNSTLHLDNIPAILRSQLQHFQHRVQLCQEFARTPFGIFHETEFRNLETLISLEGQRRTQLLLRHMADFANQFTRLSNNILAYGQTQFQQAKYVERNFTESNYTTKEIKWDDFSLYNARGQRNSNIIARHSYFSAPHIDLQGNITLPTIHSPLELQSEQDKINHTHQVLESIHQLVGTLHALWRNLDNYIGRYLVARHEQAREVYAAISEQFSRLKAQQEHTLGARHVVGYNSEWDDADEEERATTTADKAISDSGSRRRKLPTLTEVYNCTNEHELRAMQVTASMMVNKAEELHTEWYNLGQLLDFMVTFRGEPKDAQQERYCYVRLDTHPFAPEVTFNIANLTARLPFQRMRNHLPHELRWLFTSATLYTDKEHNYLTNNLGLTTFTNSAQVSSPFKSTDMAMLYFSKHESQHANHAHLNADALELILANEGKCLWLCTSRKRVEQLYEVLQTALDESVRKDAIKYFTRPSSELEYTSHDAYIKDHRYTVLAQVNDANKQELVDALRNNSRTILIATRSFWEGVNVVGDNLSLLILDKFPYPQLNAYYKVLQQTLNSHVYNNDYYVADGFIQFKQGVGRLIRNEDDFGVVAILESRISNTGRGLGPMVYQKILANYPTYRLAPDLQTAQQFLQRKRAEFYELQASKSRKTRQEQNLTTLMHVARSVYLRQPQLNYDNMRLNYDANNSIQSERIILKAMKTFERFDLRKLDFRPLTSTGAKLSAKGMATMDKLMSEVETNLHATRAAQQEESNLSIDLFANS